MLKDATRSDVNMTTLGDQIFGLGVYLYKFSNVSNTVHK